MARHIRLPGIVDMVLVSDPAEIRALDDQPKIDRNFIPRGPLVNRLVIGRICRWFQIMGQLLPSLTARGDQVRTARQEQLIAALDPAHESSQGSMLWTNAQIDSLAAYVRGADGEEAAAITTQEIVGRLFDAQYHADRASWQAAKMIDQFRDGFSPIQIVWQLTGQLRRARDILVDRAKDDRWTMHGTAIGVHGIVHALARMRALRALPTATSFSDDAVLGQCLAPPKQVPRTVEAPFETPFVRDSLKAGAIVMLQLGTAGSKAPDGEMVFMRDHWNACPARAFVTELLKMVWQRSLSSAVG
jgi:hypothetical protein